MPLGDSHPATWPCRPSARGQGRTGDPTWRGCLPVVTRWGGRNAIAMPGQAWDKTLCLTHHFNIPANSVLCVANNRGILDVQEAQSGGARALSIIVEIIIEVRGSGRALGGPPSRGPGLLRAGVRALRHSIWEWREALPLPGTLTVHQVRYGFGSAPGFFRPQ